jgi:DNA-binding response OmpR family regulator
MAKKDKIRIVIVDDDTDLLAILTNAFRSHEFDVTECQTGKEARNFLLKKENLADVGLIILDRMLPDDDGLDILIEFMRQNPKPPPIIILSILSSEKDVLKGLKMGAVEYIAKPFSLDVLMAKALFLMSREKT